MAVIKSFEHAGKIVNRFAIRKNNQFLLAVWNELVDETPVLTGAARSNWFLTPGRRAYRNNPRDGTIYPRPAEPNIYRYTDRWRNWYITNTSDYIGELNRGSSRKAPAGFVDTVLQRNMIKFQGTLVRPR